MDGLKRSGRVVSGGHMCLSNENSPLRVGLDVTARLRRA